MGDDASRPTLPVTIKRLSGGYCLRDATGHQFAYTYGEDEPGRRNAAGLPTMDQALALTRLIARLVTDSAETASSALQEPVEAPKSIPSSGRARFPARPAVSDD